MSLQSSEPNAQATRSALPQLIHTYMLVIHIVLPALLYFLLGQKELALLTPRWRLLVTDPVVIGLIVIGAGMLYAGREIPRFMLRQAKERAFKLPGSGSGHPLSDVITPYIVRLSLFELCTMAGFVAGFLRDAPELSLPFAAAGLAGTLLSPPTAHFFEQLRRA